MSNFKKELWDAEASLLNWMEDNSWLTIILSVQFALIVSKICGLISISWFWVLWPVFSWLFVASLVIMGVCLWVLMIRLTKRFRK